MLPSIRRIVPVWTAFVLIAFSAQAAEPLFKEILDKDFAKVALPGVYRVYSIGSGHVTVPETVNVNFTLLDSDSASEISLNPAAGKFSRTELQWRLIAARPDRYLTARGEIKARPFSSENYSTGSSFAVSREGILLTNRHVVSSIEGDGLEAEMIATLNPDCLPRLQKELESKLGKWNGDRDSGLEIQALLCEWLGSQCHLNAKFERAFVGLAFTTQPQAALDPALAAARLFVPDTEHRELIAAPVTVVARGGPELSDDVAILRINANVQDALVCLPLAEESQIRLGGKVCSLGFPGHRYEDLNETQYRYHVVNVESGRIEVLPFVKSPQHLRMRMLLQEKGLTGEPDPFLIISAEIRHGSSGGPVVLENGSVAGLNVAFRMLNSNQGTQPAAPAANRPFLNQWKPAASVDIAVPIAVAKKMLAENGIVPDLGPTTAIWREGLQEYRAGNMAAAEAKFREVARRQVMRPKVNKPYEPPAGPPVSIVNHSVQIMIDACRPSAK